MTADEEETQCVLLLFRGLDKESFDSCSDEAGETHGRARIWRQLNKEYEVIPVDSRPFTLSVFDGDEPLKREPGRAHGSLGADRCGGSWRIGA